MIKKSILTVLLFLVAMPLASAAQRIPSGTTDHYVNFKMVDATDRATAETGLTTFTVYRSRDGATPVLMTTPTIVELSAANMPGVYALLCDEDTTVGAGNVAENMVYTISHAGAANADLATELFLTVRDDLAVELARIDANITSRNATTPPTVGAIATQVRTELTTELGRIDVATSTRNAVAPDNATITTINGKLPANTSTQIGLIEVMRGTDSALLASSYTVPDNATIGTINGKLPADTATKIGLIEAMRGTDSALLASSYVAPDNASITAILADTAPLGNMIIADQWTAASMVNSPISDATLALQNSINASLTELKGSGFVEADDSNEAIRNRGDAAWVTGAGGGGGGSISAKDVSPKRTFFVGRESSTSRSIVTIKQTTSGSITLSLEPELNEGSDIDQGGAHTVTVVGTATLTVSNITVRPDGEAIHFDIPGNSAPDTYTVTVNVVTVDSQTIGMTGKLIIE